VADPWSPAQYDRFRAERAQPFRDLLALVQPRPGMLAVDLGCGTGDMTLELHRALGARETLGLDNSASMLAKAPRAEGLRFEQGDIVEFTARGRFDLVFSNAALHWVDDHRELFPRLLEKLRPGGQLLVQVPSNHEHPAHRLAGTLAAEEPFRGALGGWVRRPSVLALDEYAHLLHGAGAVEVELLEKVYLHQLADAEAVAEWTRGTTLLPYLGRLGDLADAYLARYRERLAGLMPGRPVLFTFRRILMSARRGDSRSED
jgi:trans-aconitate 2-methyltransferase